MIGILYVGLKRSEFFDSIATMLRNGIIAAALILLLAGIASLVTTRRLMRPLGELGGIMQKIAGGDLSHDVPMTDRADEIGRMAESVNLLLGSAGRR